MERETRTYENCFQMKSKSDLTRQFIGLEDTRVDEGIALHTLLIFHDDFDTRGQRREDRILNKSISRSSDTDRHLHQRNEWSLGYWPVSDWIVVSPQRRSRQFHSVLGDRCCPLRPYLLDGCRIRTFSNLNEKRSMTFVM